MRTWSSSARSDPEPPATHDPRERPAKLMEISECPCCGAKDFHQVAILWPELIEEWSLTEPEAAYIDRQQGLRCRSCQVNLRSMTLGRAILDVCGFDGTLEQFVATQPELSVLEVNEAGDINRLLAMLPHHRLARFPEIDLTDLPFADDSFDLVVHSDTLEHIGEPVQALAETLRVLRPGGATCYTVPVVVGRMTAQCGDVPSYHGSRGNDEYLVVTEYGADMWTQVMQAGFGDCRLLSLDYPASVAITGVKRA
jgi:SAM-dependent methyltransferase